ncbi:MAG: phytoene/squalene synthetase [Alphaproteobacteria bacterium]|nr:phytoene/squalene synthetase [Alphaproteobacteria bacterium]
MKGLYRKMGVKNLSYCGELVRKHDPDRFLISMFAPADVREDLWALFAFNHEIAKTREIVSDTTLGLIRLQWWRDALKDIYEGKDAPEHEILKPLAAAIKKHNLPKEDFETLIYAREFDLEDVLPGNMEGLLNYADFTTTPILKQALRICGDDPEQHVIQPVATNYTLAGIIRATSFLIHHGRYLLPEDLMNKYYLTRENLMSEKKRPHLIALVKEVADHKLGNAEPNQIILKSSEVLSDIYFQHIQTHSYDVLSPHMAREPFFKVLRLWFKTRLG